MFVNIGGRESAASGECGGADNPGADNLGTFDVFLTSIATYGCGCFADMGSQAMTWVWSFLTVVVPHERRSVSGLEKGLRAPCVRDPQSTAAGR